MDMVLDKSLRVEIEKFSQAFEHLAWIEPGYSFSIKTSWCNMFGARESLLLISQVGWGNACVPPPEDWAVVRLDALQSLIELDVFDPKNLSEALLNCRALHNSPVPSSHALLHSGLSSKYVCFGEPLSILAASCLSGPDQLLREWYGETISVAPFEPDIRLLCQKYLTTAQNFSSHILLNRGLMVGGDFPEECRDQFARLNKTASDNLSIYASVKPDQADLPSETTILPKIRAIISAIRGRPLVLYLDDTTQMREFMNVPASDLIVQNGLPVPSCYSRTGMPVRWPAEDEVVESLPPESALGASVVFKDGLGVIAAADSVWLAEEAAGYFIKGVSVVQSARQSGEYKPPAQKDLEFAAQWTTVKRYEHLPFSGEVALVTGAASGIGKAIADSLLKRGSTVIGLDVNPSIAETFHHPCYAGMVCNVVDEEMICQAFRKVARQFGGLDMLILNAGMFPGGCQIEKLTLAEFTQVLNINFVSNMVILREAIPL